MAADATADADVDTAADAALAGAAATTTPDTCDAKCDQNAGPQYFDKACVTGGGLGRVAQLRPVERSVESAWI
jgi:hypothetical protein